MGKMDCDCPGYCLFYFAYTGCCCECLVLSRTGFFDYRCFSPVTILRFLFFADKKYAYHTKSRFRICCRDGLPVFFTEHKLLPEITRLPGRKTACRFNKG